MTPGVATTTVLMLITTIIAQATGGGGGDAINWVTPLLNSGPFAMFLVLIVMDKITTPGERDRLRTENANLKEELKQLNSSLREEVMPPLIQMTGLMKDVIEVVNDANERRSRERLRRQIIAEEKER